MHYWDYYFGFPFMWIFWLVFLVLFIVILFRVINVQGRSRPSRETPLDILKKRYASGEITKEEYLERKKVLEGKG